MGLTGLRSDTGKASRRIVKFEKAKQFYEKVKNTVAASLAIKKTISKSKRTRSRQKKLKAYDLSSFTDVLPDVNVPTPQPDVTNMKVNCKSRMKLVEREGRQLKGVLSHPAFQSDPISAIRQHLEHTQPPSICQLPGRKDKKSTKKKQRSSSDSMEM